MELTHSPELKNITAALAKAQAAFAPAVKGNSNPFFKSKYADLATMIEATRKPLADEGIAVVQSPSLTRVGEPAGGKILCELSMHTMLLHASGEWIAGTMACVLPSAEPQVIGSGTTYLRRYHYCAMVGIAPEDDDGEGAMGRRSPTNGHREIEEVGKEEPLLSKEQVKEIEAKLAAVGSEAARLLSWLQYAETLSEVYAKDYDRIIAALEKKGKKA